MPNPNYHHPDVTPGTWATQETIEFFLELHEVQESTGIIDAWRRGHLDYMSQSPEDFSDPEARQSYLEELDLKLPLAVALSALPIIEGEDGPWLGLVKVNPLSGAVYPDTFGYVAVLQRDGELTEPNGMYNHDQITTIEVQFGELAIRGIRITV